METIKCIKERRSIRNFEEKKVPRELIEEIVSAAVYAPSWKNTQITRYIVIEDKAVKKAIADNCIPEHHHNSKIILNAPQLVLVTYVSGRSGFEKDGTYSTSKGDRWENFDAGIAVQTFCLAAHDKGVGTLIMGIFDENKVSEVVPLPEGQKTAALVAMGYLSGNVPDAPKRKSAEEVLTFI